MKKKTNRIYPASQIYIGYVTTVNPDAYDSREEFQKRVAAFRKIKNERGNDYYLPLEKHFPYYIEKKLVPIKKWSKRKGIITQAEIERIVVMEQQKNNPKQIMEHSVEIQEILEEQTQKKVEIKETMTEELDTTKQKKLVA